MPIYESDPWRRQYFRSVRCPPDVHIPTDDAEAYIRYPRQRWIYNKLAVAHSQGLDCAPHGVEPSHYPVFSKPITNLRGMGIGSCTLHNAVEYRARRTPGHFWMPLLVGDHVSSDAAVIDGEILWCRHAIGEARAGGTFDYWTIDPAPRPELESYCHAWVRTHLSDYRGMLNIESIGNRIIELHLRFTDQWPDLYGPAWLDALVRLYQHGAWHYPDSNFRIGYSVVLFGAHGRDYHHPAREEIAALTRVPEVSSIQVTFHEDQGAELHAMPPGGFRLAIVNCWKLDVGRLCRERLEIAIRDAAPTWDRRCV